jgi:AraC family transcriptional regulator of adaptative response / DNA-3-methyladenine glycosylase II
VTSTGIYCRPVCRVRTAAARELPLLRPRRPGRGGRLPPLPALPARAGTAARRWSTEDASRILALQAARLIDEPDAWSEEGPGAAQIAARLGVSDRHLRRIFEAQFGVSPLQYLQTRRLLAAKQLIADTRLPMTQVALASGFASVRRFNAAFVEHYGLNPSALRRAGGATAEGGSGEGKAIEVRLGFRPPYDTHAMLAFFARRALRGVERASTADGKEPVKGSTPTYAKLARTLRVQQGAQTHAGWLQLRFDVEREQMLLSVSDSLAAVLPIVISRARAMFDLDAEPMAINAALHAAFPHGDGLRVPGTVDGFELAVRAVLGQQITVAAARTLGSRLVEAFGEAIATPVEGLNRLFPTPAAIAAASGDALGQLGIVRQRQTALQAIAREVAAGKLALHAGPTCHRPSRRCRSCRASAPGPRSTSPCARCAGPTPFRPATSRCRRRWA